ncbi:methyltransferase-like protein 24 isoform X2 [Electrophorus electricus]|uniref:methyltransferase-like protein 24 isoform X2 n=1 Tax=Electrophorus electricus TaxID=8005 RepID=UPI0015D0A3ED|nr:methyltransferase-like protein 24 isoform X2 [Electrophorus electricus]
MPVTGHMREKERRKSVMLKQRVSRWVLLRVCMLLSILCVCAHVYVEFKGYGLRTWWRVIPLLPKHPQHNSKPPSLSEATGRWRDSKIACCPPIQQYRKALRWKIELEPWASDGHNLEAEAVRFIKYITTPQVSCEIAMPPALQREEAQKSWVLCLDDKFPSAQRLNTKHCRVYSLRLGGEDLWLEKALATAGCEVHCFDPSIGAAHLQDSGVWLHRLSIDWREPNPAISAQRQRSSTKKLAAILNDFGHRQDDLLPGCFRGANHSKPMEEADTWKNYSA